MKINGVCHCGQVSYEAEIEPANIAICHCTDCQTLSGSAFRTIVPVLKNTFQLRTGTLKTYVKTSASGAKRAQVFCPECGTPIYAGPVGATEDVAVVRLGSICQRHELELRPQRQIWCGSAASWVDDLSSITKMM